MKWSQIKNIILMILLIVNITLLAVVAKREYDATGFVEAAKENAVAVLASSGISVTAELPEDNERRVLQMNWVRDSAVDRSQAEAILGKELKQKDDSGGTSATFHSEGGSVTLRSNGEFLVDLKPGVWHAGEEDTVINGQRFLALLGIDAELVNTDRHTYQDGSGTVEDELVLTYRQRWEGAPVFSCRAVVTFQGGSLIHAAGDRLAGTAVEVGSETAFTAPTMLLRFLSEVNRNGYVCSQITSVTAGYEASRMRLTPVWAITTDNKTTYYLNGITGVLSLTD